MKTLYFECGMGAAGDMLMAALLELCDNPDGFIERLNNAGIPNVNVSAETAVKCGITGTRVIVKINGYEEECGLAGHSHEHDAEHCNTHSHHKHEHHSHEHNSYKNTEHLISQLNVSDNVKKNALDVYKLIADAESHAHGVPIEQVHFHEVGTMDAIADIVGVCMLIEKLAPEKIISSPINVGWGQVRCAHGILPVPAPATAHILQGVPVCSGQFEGELCTPTGAALLKHFTDEFCRMPKMTLTKLGYGMGKKDFERANCVRVFSGETDSKEEKVVELVCNLDDMTPEAAAFAQQLLLEEGALDVYTVPTVMKKGRLGISFNCMCNIDAKEKMLALIFKHTTTLGIREYSPHRHTLQKEYGEMQTKFGKVGVKTSSGFGVKKVKLEYEDVAEAARKNQLSLQDISETID